MKFFIILKYYLFCNSTFYTSLLSQQSFCADASSQNGSVAKGWLTNLVLLRSNRLYSLLILEENGPHLKFLTMMT